MIVTVHQAEGVAFTMDRHTAIRAINVAAAVKQATYDSAENYVCDSLTEADFCGTPSFCDGCGMDFPFAALCICDRPE